MTDPQPKEIHIRKVLGYYWRFCLAARWYFWLAMVFGGASILLGFFLVPVFLKYFFDAIFEFGGGDRTEIWGTLRQIIFWVLAINIFGFWVLARASEYFLIRWQTRSLYLAENFIFQRILNHSTNFFANEFAGSLVSKFNRFVRAQDQIGAQIYFHFWPNLLRLVASTAITGYFAPKIAIILGIWVVVFLAVIFWVIWKYHLPKNLKVASNESALSGLLADTFTNAWAIKTSTSRDREVDFFESETQNLYWSRRRAWTAWVQMNVFRSMMVTFLELISLYLMAQMWMAGEISVGTIVMIQTFLVQIYVNLWNFGGVLEDFFRSMADSAQMVEILELAPEITDPKNPEKSRISKGKIEFRAVNFGYEKGEKVLSNFNLEISAGEKVGIVGRSGAGKTTISKLLLRFVDLGSGAIEIDGQNIAKITQHDLRSCIAFVPQEPILFHRSLFENIKYSLPSATRAQVFDAARKAHAFDFIQKSPEKWETKVGERGIKLSGGEKQRIAIARAILKKTPILVLDEATSALDSEVEKEIQKALETVMQNRTTLVIAHRLSTLKKLDRIIVLEKGQIVESGTHIDLMAKKGIYAELWSHQSGGFLR